VRAWRADWRGATLDDGRLPYQREVVAVEGWRSVEELIGWGFAHAPVVMVNEAHNGLARCVRTREVGVRMIRAAREAGVRRLAMEALPWPARGTPGPILAIPPARGGYLAQPEMRRLIGAALELGWSLWAYEAADEGWAIGDTEPAELLTLDFANWRDREQARNLRRVLAVAPAEPLLVWAGGDHARKEPIAWSPDASQELTQEWVTMGCQFPALSGTTPFVIDQTVSITFGTQAPPWLPRLLAALSEILAAHGGTAGILRDQAPEPLTTWPGVDAVVVSTENTLT
jgi:hypothetical protein